MPTSLSKLHLLDQLFEPIQRILRTILPDFAEETLQNDATREAIVALADKALISQYPQARVIPTSIRRKIIRGVLDVMIDEVLLGVDESTAAAADELGGIDGVLVDLRDGVEIKELLGGLADQSWNAEPVYGLDNVWHVRPDGGHISTESAFEIVRSISLISGVVSAEPSYSIPIPNAEEVGPGLQPAGGPPKTFPPMEWSVTDVRAKEAWNLEPPNDEGRQRGEGIIIGHPDTGYTFHPENFVDNALENRLLWKLGRDVWDGDANAQDDLDSHWESMTKAGFVALAGHGTGTASVIFSGDGKPSNSAIDEFVTGIAPRAKLIPYRVAPTVVIWNPRKLAEAINLATDAGCHVISMSMGGLPSKVLHQAVRRAVDNGVIVCSAAGNYFGASDLFPIVVWPAAYREVVAVAASNVDRVPWKGSSRGRLVDITAPGEDVWHAVADRGKPLQEVRPGSGTSFAVATTAGIAALWLAHHGRSRLIAKYGDASFIPLVFQQILATEGFVAPPDWDTRKFGPGIIDAVRVLKAPLPDSVAVAAGTGGNAEDLRAIFDDVPRERVTAVFGELLGVSDSALESTLADFGQELTHHVLLDPQLRADLQGAMLGVAGHAGGVPPSIKTLKQCASSALRDQIAL